MKKYVLIALLALLLVFSAGCAKKEDSEKTTPFYGGTGGVSIEFKKIAPKDNFNQGEEVPVVVSLKNSGEYDIISGNAKAEIYGINHELFNIPEGYKGTNGILRGRGEFNIEGGEREISFGNMKYTGEIINSREQIIRARVCYPYQTKTDIPICIKSSGENGESICSVDGEKVVSQGKNTGSGYVSSAPIQITSVAEKTRGSNQVRFDIKVENKGSGRVYSNDATCESLSDELVQQNKMDKIYLEVINPLEVTCGFRSGEDSNKGYIEMDNNQEIISCWIESENTYTDTLRLTLSYMYTDTTQKKITIFEK